MDIDYRSDDEGFDVRYVDGKRQGRVPHSNICDDQTEYVIRYTDCDEEGTTRWRYRHLGSGFRNVDAVTQTLQRLPGPEDGQNVQILLNFGRVKEEFGMERITSLMGPDQYIPVYRLASHKERTLNVTYRKDVEHSVVDSEPSARGRGPSPTDIEPVLFRSLLELIRDSDRIESWDEGWDADEDTFQRGEFYAKVHAPLFAAYSIVDEEVVELVNRYHLEKGNGKELEKSFIHCGFKTKLSNVSTLFSSREEDTILSAWKHRNDLIHGIHSRFGVKLLDIDFELLGKQLLFSIMKTRTLNGYVNSARYRTAVETPEAAVSHLIGTSDLQDAVEAARKAMDDERYFKPLVFSPEG